MAKLALQAEGHELELLAAVEGEGEEEEGAGPATQAVSSEPTMMSREARDMFLNGDKGSALAAWKVGVGGRGGKGLGTRGGEAGGGWVHAACLVW
jgi:hypothetical protein